MSGQAMHRVCVNGPADDHRLYVLLVNVADWCDASCRNAAPGMRVLMARVGCGWPTLNRLLFEAVADGWLTVQKPGDSRRRTVYDLGPNLMTPEVQNEVMSRSERRSVAAASVKARHNCRGGERESATQTSTVLDVGKRPPADRGGGQSFAGDNGGRVLGITPPSTWRGSDEPKSIGQLLRAMTEGEART